MEAMAIPTGKCGILRVNMFEEHFIEDAISQVHYLICFGGFDLNRLIL